MQYEKVKPYIKWGIYYLLLLVLFALQTTPNLFEINGIKPILIIPLVVAVCMFEDIMPSAVFAMISGLLWDVTSDKLLGFNGLVLLCTGLLIAVLCVYYLHTKLLNSFLFCAAILVIQGLLDYTFYFLIWDTDSSSIVLVKSLIPTAIYSIIFALPFYYLVRAISRRFNDVTRV